MAAKGRERDRDRERLRFVYVTRFGSHQCGSVLRLGGRRALGPWSPALGAGRSQEGAQAVAAGTAGGTEPPAGSRPRAPEASCLASASSVRSGSRPTARGGLTQKNLAKKFDFPIPLNEASKIMKKKKKVSVWNGVYKVISKMLEENEKYRLRLKCQQLSRENSNYTR
uniref:Chromosome 5 open reading frame 47 n=1 Tax=Catagonus wagneri TaxID=51154 RepID=A0A8C3YE49_9CETA